MIGLGRWWAVWIVKLYVYREVLLEDSNGFLFLEYGINAM